MEEADKPKGFGKGGKALFSEPSLLAKRKPPPYSTLRQGKGKGKGFMWDPWQWGWMNLSGKREFGLITRHCSFVPS